MEFPIPPKPQASWLVRQTCDQPIPEMDPVEAAEWSKVLNGYHEEHWKPIMERAYAADKVWRLANKDMIEAKEAAWEKLIKDGKVFKDMNEDKNIKYMNDAKDIMGMIDEFRTKGSKDDSSKDDKGDA
jgi:hypothetical protein